jgi:hypothetical protein
MQLFHMKTLTITLQYGKIILVQNIINVWYVQIAGHILYLFTSNYIWHIYETDICSQSV